MIINQGDFIFWDYVDEYGVFDKYVSLIGFRDDVPEEVKKSWEEYQKLEKVAMEKGLK